MAISSSSSSSSSDNKMSAHDKNGLGFGTQMDDLSNKSETISENNLTVFEVRSSDDESTIANDRDEVIIEDWTSDDEDYMCSDKIVSSVKPNVTQAVRSQTNKKCTGHLIKDCDFYDQKSPEPRVKKMVNTGKREVKPVWDYGKRGNLEILLQDHAVVDSGCSSHMTGNKAYLSDYEDFNGGFDELKFNLFSVSQMCDKKNSVLFTETECLILSPSFKLLDESQVVLRAPRKDDVYSLDLKNIVPSGEPYTLSHELILPHSSSFHSSNGTVGILRQA
ncbi:hypothetical protein Tco_1231620 [Tanacetum coccineum]